MHNPTSCGATAELADLHLVERREGYGLEVVFGHGYCTSQK